MPDLQRTRQPGQSEVGKDSQVDREWPLKIALIAVFVFVVVLIKGEVLMGMVMATATLMAGAILLTLTTGTSWIARLLRLRRPR